MNKKQKTAIFKFKEKLKLDAIKDKEKTDIKKMTKEEIIHFELTTGIPVMYDYKNGKFEKKTNL